MGHEFDTSYSSKIERGITTKAEIRQNFGDPHDVTVTSRGEVWGYRHARGGNLMDSYKMMLGADRKLEVDMLQITFDGETVKDFTFSQSK